MSSQPAHDALVRPTVPVKLTWGVAAALVVAYALHAQFGLGGNRLDGFFLKWVNDSIVLLAAALCIWRAAAVRVERLAWALLGLGMAFWSLGNVYFTIFVIDQHPLPIPSFADALFLATYPTVFIGIVLLARARIRNVGMGSLLDGLIAALGVGSISSAVVVEAVLQSSTDAGAAATVTNLAYPLCDLVLLGLVVGTLALNGWRLDRMWALLATSLTAFAVTDGVYLFKVSDGTYVPGTIYDAGWLVAALLLACAAWAPITVKTTPRRDSPLLASSGVFGLVGLTILIWDHVHRVNLLSLVLASSAILAVIVRMIIIFADGLRRARDETELLAGQNERLLELDRVREAFVGVVSHELRTPLTSVCGYLELLREGEGGPVTPEQDQLMAVIARNAERLLRLIGDLLFIGQAEAGQLALDIGPIALVAIATESVEAARTEATDEGIELLLSEGRPVPVLVGDEGRIGQLFDNLISNALKFTPRGGQVTVRVGHAGTAAYVEVADTGPGISAEDRQHLFERFFRTASAADGSIPGSGLGLSIAQAIALAHDGTIAVSSELGVGTTFRFELPLEVGAPDDDPETVPALVSLAR